MDLTAKLNGFTVESTSGVKVFEPFDASATYAVVAGLKNIHIDMTDIYTNFSFSILQLILRLEDDVMSIMRITSEQITAECSEFEKIWADDGKTVSLHLCLFPTYSMCMLRLATPNYNYRTMYLYIT